MTFVEQVVCMFVVGKAEMMEMIEGAVQLALGEEWEVVWEEEAEQLVEWV